MQTIILRVRANAERIQELAIAKINKADRLDVDGTMACVEQILEQCFRSIIMVHDISPSLTYQRYMDMLTKMHEVHHELVGTDLPLVPYEPPVATSTDVEDFAVGSDGPDE